MENRGAIFAASIQKQERETIGYSYARSSDARKHDNMAKTWRCGELVDVDVTKRAPYRTRYGIIAGVFEVSLFSSCFSFFFSMNAACMFEGANMVSCNFLAIRLEGLERLER